MKKYYFPVSINIETIDDTLAVKGSQRDSRDFFYPSIGVVTLPKNDTSNETLTRSENLLTARINDPAALSGFGSGLGS